MANDLDILTANLTNYVVAPLNAFGIGGFAFDSDAESLAELRADVTDHYTEDNNAIQDHVAIKPNRITLKGFVGEVVYTTTPADQTFLQQAVQKLTTISAFLPTLSAAATQIQTVLSSPDPLQAVGDFSIADTTNIYSLVKNLIGSFGNEARQQKAYLYFKALMNSKILMGVQTPWEFIPNMLIESIHAIQTEDTIYVSDFAVTLKELRFAQTATVAYSTTLQGQNSLPASAPQATQDNLSPQANQAALNQYRSQSGLSTPPIDVQLQGAAAVQAPDPVTIGNVPGVSLPSNSLPGLQGQLKDVSGLIPAANASSLSTTSPYSPSLSSIFVPPPPPPAN